MILRTFRAWPAALANAPATRRSPFRSRRTTRPRSLAPALLCLAAACATPHPDAEMARLRALVAGRGGADVDLRAAWLGAPREPLPAVALTAAEAGRLAVANHPAVRVALAEVAVARAAFARADRLPNPMAEMFFGQDGVWMGAVLQPLAFLWQRGPDTRAADAELEAALLRAGDAALAAASAARRAHARCWFARARHDVAAHAARLAADLAAAVAARAEAGEANAIAAERARARSLQAADEATAAALDADAAARELLAAAGWAEAIDEPALAEPPGMQGWPPDLEPRLVELADAQRLDVLAARVAMARALAARDRAAWAALPRLDGGGRAEREHDGSRMRVVGAVVDLPLFDVGAIARASADAEVRAAAHHAELVRQTALAGVRALAARGRAALERAVRLEQAWLPSAQALAAHVRAAADAGARDPLEVLEAELEALDVHARALAARAEAADVLAELPRAVGGALPEPRATGGGARSGGTGRPSVP